MKKNVTITYIALLITATTPLYAGKKKKGSENSSPSESSQLAVISNSSSSRPDSSLSIPSITSEDIVPSPSSSSNFSKDDAASAILKKLQDKKHAPVTGWEKPENFTDILCIPDGRLIRKANLDNMISLEGTPTTQTSPAMPKSHFTQTIEACKSLKQNFCGFYKFKDVLPIIILQEKAVLHKFYPLEIYNRANTKHELIYCLDGKVISEETYPLDNGEKENGAEEWSANWIYSIDSTTNPFYDEYYESRKQSFTQKIKEIDLLDQRKKITKQETPCPAYFKYERNQPTFCTLKLASKVLSKEALTQQTEIVYSPEIHKKNAIYSAGQKALEDAQKELNSVISKGEDPQSPCPAIIYNDLATQVTLDGKHILLDSHLDTVTKPLVFDVINRLNRPDLAALFINKKQQEISKMITDIVRKTYKGTNLHAPSSLIHYIERRALPIQDATPYRPVITPANSTNKAYIHALVTVREATRNHKDLIIPNYLIELITKLQKKKSEFIHGQLISIQESYKLPQQTVRPIDPLILQQELDLQEAMTSYVGYVAARNLVAQELQNNAGLNPDMPSGDTEKQKFVVLGEKTLINANNAATTILEGTKILCNTISSLSNALAQTVSPQVPINCDGFSTKNVSTDETDEDDANNDDFLVVTEETNTADQKKISN